MAGRISTLFNPSHSLSFPLPSSTLVLLFSFPSSLALFASSPLLSSPPLVRPVLPRASACTARHIHTDKMAYTVPVVQIAGNCSPRRGLSSSSSSAFVERGEGPGRSLESVWNCEFYDLQTWSFIRVYGSGRAGNELRTAPVTSADQPRDNCTPRTHDLLPRFTISSGFDGEGSRGKNSPRFRSNRNLNKAI